MKVSMSSFLMNQKPILKKIVNLLSENYKYVSILGTDTKGKIYNVQKTGIDLSDSHWCERGFVIRVHNGINYSEFSFNEINENNLNTIVDEIHLKMAKTLERLKNASITINTYELIEEALIKEQFLGEVTTLPSSLTSKEKIEKMCSIKDSALSYSDLLVDFKVTYHEVHVSKIFISNNKELEQSYIWSEGYLVSIVRRDENTKYARASFSGLKAVELIDEMENNIEKVIDTSIKLLDARSVIPGEYEVICSPEISGLIAHEAFGHGVEMDMFVKKRAKSMEYLGKSVASELVTMHDGAAAASNMSSYLFDDEGVLGTDTIVIEKGQLKTGISDILSALKLGTTPTGNGKRESFERKAYARMTNTFFTAGNDTLEAMIASIKHGYVLDGTMSGMEDPKNWGIQCMILQGSEIKDGRLTGKIISPVIMTGYVPDVLKSISMLSETVELSGSGACGKGYKEWVKVSDGGPYIKAKVRLG
ncbi:TldD/PmbA family protein [Clostridium tagluense]|uniref:TldD/PmbA family protein n=1 Tax=Clostridium tagluense TaxID=360422 RepID=UPI001CF310CA|nr:TldD/PmbA family protein [Clostridium tagluense]MCB2299357.1 TldD/PmbA family protein [Clostridium tagluense]